MGLDLRFKYATTTVLFDLQGGGGRVDKLPHCWVKLQCKAVKNRVLGSGFRVEIRTKSEFN